MTSQVLCTQCTIYRRKIGANLTQGKPLQCLSMFCTFDCQKQYTQGIL